MAMTAGDPLLEGPRIRTVLKHIRIVVGFEKDDVASFGKALHAVIYPAEVSHYRHRRAILMIKDPVAHRSVYVVRCRKSPDFGAVLERDNIVFFYLSNR